MFDLKMENNTQQGVSRTKSFVIPSRDSTWIPKILEIIRGKFPPNYSEFQFHGYYETASADVTNETHSNIKSWQDGIISHWEEIDYFDASFSKRASSQEISLVGDLRNDTLELEIRDLDSSEIERLFAEIGESFQNSTTLKLVLRSKPSGLVTEERQYFVKCSIDEKWLNDLVDIANDLATKNSFNGQYTVSKIEVENDENFEFEQTHYENDIFAWREKLSANSGKIINFSVQFRYLSFYIELSCDTLREFVTLRLETNSDVYSSEIISKFQNRLNLKLAPDIPWNFRMIGEYKVIAGWSVEKFVNALQEAIDYYVGSKYKIDEAYILKEQNDAEPVSTSFLSIDELIKHLRNENNKFVGVSVALEGPLGKGLGVHVRGETEDLIQPTLWLKSTLKQSGFSNLKSLFTKSKLKLEKNSETDTETEESKKWHDYFLGKAAISIIAALGTTFLGLVSWEGIQYIQPVYTLRIIQPSTEGKVREILKGTPVSIHWEATYEHLRNNKVAEPQASTITIYKNGGTILEGGEPNSFNSGDLLTELSKDTIPDGEYEIYVKHPKVAESEYVTIKIVSELSDSQNPETDEGSEIPQSQ